VGADVRDWQIGDYVTTPFVQACGRCSYCEVGDHQVCENQEQAGFTTFGAYAEFVEVKFADVNLVRIPSEMSFEVAAVLGCRFGTAYRAVVDQAGVLKDQSVVVFGCGGVGLSIIAICKALGATVHAFDPNPQALKMASDSGADFGHRVIPGKSATDLSGLHQMAHHVFDAVGHTGVLGHGLELLCRRGKFIQVGLIPSDQQVVFTLDRLVAHELELKGSHGIQAHRYQSMLSFLVQSQINLERLITNRCDFSQAISRLVSMDSLNHWGIDLITKFR
jgi:alcohol dehydrogenase